MFLSVGLCSIILKSLRFMVKNYWDPKPESPTLLFLLKDFVYNMYIFSITVTSTSPQELCLHILSKTVRGKPKWCSAGSLLLFHHTHSVSVLCSFLFLLVLSTRRDFLLWIQIQRGWQFSAVLNTCLYGLKNSYWVYS